MPLWLKAYACPGGRAGAKLVLINTDTDEIFGFFSGKGKVTGDVVSVGRVREVIPQCKVPQG
jgi:hypothetical protein